MKSLLPIGLVSAFAALALSACKQQPTVAPSIPAGAASTATTFAATSHSAGTAGLPGDHADTKRYKIAITLPTLPADQQPLADALRTTADNAKREFVKALPDPVELPEFADRQLQLLLDFKIAANTSAFTSIRETGMQDTGGAHPIPVQAAFVFDRTAGRLIALDELFVDPDAARTALAKFAHKALLRKFTADVPRPEDGSSPAAIREWKSNMMQMLDDGTKPTAANYSVFVVRAGGEENPASPGLSLIFPPYQVAPYVYGTQTIDVPANVFAHFLKSEYKNAFETH